MCKLINEVFISNDNNYKNIYKILIIFITSTVKNFRSFCFLSYDIQLKNESKMWR